MHFSGGGGGGKGADVVHKRLSVILQYSYSWINYAANVGNVAIPCAWSAGLYDLSRNAYRNNNLRVKILHPTTA